MIHDLHRSICRAFQLYAFCEYESMNGFLTEDFLLSNESGTPSLSPVRGCAADFRLSLPSFSARHR